MAQWLGVQTFTAKVLDLLSGQGSMVPQASCCVHKEEEERKKTDGRWSQIIDSYFSYSMYLLPLIQRTTCKDFWKSCKVGVEVVKKASTQDPRVSHRSLSWACTVQVIFVSWLRVLKPKFQHLWLLVKGAHFFPFWDFFPWKLGSGTTLE